MNAHTVNDMNCNVDHRDSNLWRCVISKFLTSSKHSFILVAPMSESPDFSLMVFGRGGQKFAVFYGFNSDESTVPDLFEVFYRDGDELIAFGQCVPWCSPKSDLGGLIGYDENDESEELVRLRFYKTLMYSTSPAPDASAQALGYAKAEQVLADLYREELESMRFWRRLPHVPEPVQPVLTQ